LANAVIAGQAILLSFEASGATAAFWFFSAPKESFRLQEKNEDIF
jgi:hypothetical protein